MKCDAPIWEWFFVFTCGGLTILEAMPLLLQDKSYSAALSALILPLLSPAFPVFLAGVCLLLRPPVQNGRSRATPILDHAILGIGGLWCGLSGACTLIFSGVFAFSADEGTIPKFSGILLAFIFGAVSIAPGALLFFGGLEIRKRRRRLRAAVTEPSPGP